MSEVAALGSFRIAGGRTLSYRCEGTGPVLVCHPGGPGFSSRYFGDLAGLGERFTLILLNPRGSEAPIVRRTHAPIRRPTTSPISTSCVRTWDSSGCSSSDTRTEA
jgi:pimeloyl-ACP methyl ester carboxylesterase